jgi:hypothetical protein
MIKFKIFNKEGESICKDGPDYRLRISILAGGKMHWSVVYTPTNEIICSSASKGYYIDLSIT